MDLESGFTIWFTFTLKFVVIDSIWIEVCEFNKGSIAFQCRDSFWPLTCKMFPIGAYASVHIKTIISLYTGVSKLFYIQSKS